MSDEPVVPFYPTAPPAPVVANEAEFKRLSDEDKAKAVFAWSEFWLGSQVPACDPPGSYRTISQIEMQLARTRADESASTAGWKQAPTSDEKAAMADEADWNKY